MNLPALQAVAFMIREGLGILSAAGGITKEAAEKAARGEEYTLSDVERYMVRNRNASPVLRAAIEEAKAAGQE